MMAIYERRRAPRDGEDRDGERWLAVYYQQTSAAIKLRLLDERETAVRGMPSEPTAAAQLAWIAREREAVVKEIGKE